MKKKFNVLDKVVILDSELTDALFNSFIEDFVCFGTVLRSYSERVDGCFVQTVVAHGTDGKIYKDQSNVEGIMIISEEEFLSRLNAERSLNPANKELCDELELALKVYQC